MSSYFTLYTQNNCGELNSLQFLFSYLQIKLNLYTCSIDTKNSWFLLCVHIVLSFYDKQKYTERD